MPVFPPIKGHPIQFTKEQMDHLEEEMRLMSQCSRCHSDLRRSIFYSDYCDSCKEIIKSEQLDEKLDNIRDLYDIEERLRMIERFIIMHQENHPSREVLFR